MGLERVTWRRWKQYAYLGAGDGDRRISLRGYAWPLGVGTAVLASAAYRV